MGNAERIAKEMYSGTCYVDGGVDINPAFIEGFINGYSLHKGVLYFTNDKNMIISYDDNNIYIRHDNETGEFTFERIRFRGDSGELLTPHWK